MRPTTSQLVIAAAILAAFVGSGSSDAQIRDRIGAAAKKPGGGGAPTIVFEPNVTLAPIGATELFGIPADSVDRGTYLPGNDVAGGVALTPTVVRTLLPVWTAWVKNKKELKDWQISYEVVAANGAADSLSHLLDGSSEIDVVLTPLDPVKVGKDGKLQIYQGGVELTLDVSTATAAGPYSGRLLVVINNI
jgi:hypothetical protein